MNSYEQELCYLVGGDRCKCWRDGDRFEYVCSVEHGSACINRAGLLGCPSARVMSDRMIRQEDAYNRRQHPKLKSPSSVKPMLEIMGVRM